VEGDNLGIRVAKERLTFSLREELQQCKPENLTLLR
jgi:hypothetical protein